MLRNKDFRNMLIVMSMVLFIVSLSAGLISPVCGISILLSGLILIIISILFTFKRYRDIKKLSDYLRKVYSGEYSLDLRDNMEGELSILKNEIYKVTLILMKQSELLKTEKEQLADAISDISHQLKTPLTSMMVMTDLLNDENLSVMKRKEFTKNLEYQLTRMEWLLTVLLKLAKIDAGTIKFKKEVIRVTELIKISIEPLLIPMELKEQVLIVKGDSSVSMIGDFKWLSEAVLNIVKNCMEHTPCGGEITIGYQDNPIYTEIIISDNGSGIEKEDLPYIFKRFYKGKNSGDDSVGIGLAMAYSIITCQGGDISVTSKIDKGTNFSIKFYKNVP